MLNPLFYTEIHLIINTQKLVQVALPLATRLRTFSAF